MDILVRGIDKEIWKRARIKAIKEEISMNQVILNLVKMWLKDEVKIESKKRG